MDAFKDMLLGHLQATRRHLLATMDGLDDQVMLQPLLPSRWSPAALLSHLTYDVEKFWFSQVIGGDPTACQPPNGMQEAWWIPDDADPVAIRAAYETAAAESDALFVRMGLNDPPAWWDEALFGGFRVENLADVILHVIRETTAHAGQMDVVRELIDGRQHLVLTPERQSPD